jgi:hypothetical protein
MLGVVRPLDASVKAAHKEGPAPQGVCSTSGSRGLARDVATAGPYKAWEKVG